ncbi:hypothetical protein KAR34_04835 [bacterium]|nr:hypothetical protein [bacterium]
MINLIFIHGVNSQSLGYSNPLYKNIVKYYKQGLLIKGASKRMALTAAQQLVQKEIMWTQKTNDLTNRFLTLQYGLKHRKGKWNSLYKLVDPIAIQILHYVKDKGHKNGPMTILKSVHRLFQQANKSRPEKTIVIAHSLGSVISFDYIFGFRKYKFDRQKTIDAFFTLGSPIPLFTSAMGYVENPAKHPKHLKRWINILDPDDAIARHCSRHFKHMSVKDVELNTGWDPIGTHINYWKTPRVAEYIANCLLKWNI